VGHSDQFVLVEDQIYARVAAAFSTLEIEPLGANNGWAMGRLDEHDPIAVVRILSADCGATVVGWVHDSDFAYLVAADGGAVLFELVVGEPYATAPGLDGGWLYAELDSRCASGDWRHDAAAGVAEWARRRAARRIDPAVVERALAADYDLAEEGLAAIASLLGLPDLDRLVFSRRVEPATATTASDRERGVLI
jgi:hypothetical protein